MLRQSCNEVGKGLGSVPCSGPLCRLCPALLLTLACVWPSWAAEGTSVVAEPETQAAAQAISDADEQAEILLVINRYHKAMTDRNVLVWKELLLEDGISRSFHIEPDGSTALQSLTQREQIARLSEENTHEQERIWDPWILLRGPLAIVWAPYDFYRDSQFSHCGVKAFELLKTDGQWKIGNTSETAEIGVCEKDLQRPGKFAD